MFINVTKWLTDNFAKGGNNMWLKLMIVICKLYKLMEISASKEAFVTLIPAISMVLFFGVGFFTDLAVTGGYITNANLIVNLKIINYFSNVISLVSFGFIIFTFLLPILHPLFRIYENTILIGYWWIPNINCVVVSASNEQLENLINWSRGKIFKLVSTPETHKFYFLNKTNTVLFKLAWI